MYTPNTKLDMYAHNTTHKYTLECTYAKHEHINIPLKLTTMAYIDKRSCTNIQIYMYM